MRSGWSGRGRFVLTTLAKAAVCLRYVVVLNKHCSTRVHTHIHIYAHTQRLPVPVFWSGAERASVVWWGSVTHMLSVYVVLRGLLWSGPHTICRSRLTNARHRIGFSSVCFPFASLWKYLFKLLLLHSHRFLPASTYRFHSKNNALFMFWADRHTEAFGDARVIGSWRAAFALCVQPRLTFSPC